MYKVLFLIDSLQTGGAEKSLVTIASKLKKVQPIFVYVYDGNALERNLKDEGIPVYGLNIKREYNFKDAIEKLLPLVQEIKPDIIHSTLFNSDIISRKLKKLYSVILINSFVNNSYTPDRFKKLSFLDRTKLKAFQKYDCYTSRKVDLFISNSEAIKLSNAIALDVSPDKIKVIHRGRDLSKFKNISPSQINELKNSLNIGNETILLNVGRLLERKGQMDLLIAFNELTKTQDNVKLLIAGEGGYETELKKYIKTNGLESRVLLLGNRKDIPQLLTLTDYFIFPSWYEGLPGSLIEAMMAATPIIASNIPENLECVGEDEALIFNKGDSVDMLEKITWALENKSEMIKKAGRAKNIAQAKFDINLIADEYDKTYLDIINKYSILPSQPT